MSHPHPHPHPHLGSLATFANIGGTMMLMYIVSDSYLDAITNTYIAFFFNGGLNVNGRLPNDALTRP